MFRDALIASWYGQRKPFKILSLFTKLYVYNVERLREDYTSGKKEIYKAPVPVVIVGNITVGGTGKTPMILWLIEHCRQLGLKVGVVSRGYGAKPPKVPWLVEASQSAKQAGDEPLLIVQRTQVPLVIAPKRSDAVQCLLEKVSVDIILSDDGLQHHALGRDLELVMIDATRGLGNGYCLPMGPLREPATRLQQVDAVIYNGAEQDSKEGYAMRLQPQVLVNMLSSEEKPLSHFLKGQKVHAVAGIGNPQRFFDTLAKLNLEVIPHPFDDHVVYEKAMLDFKNALPIIMTEKDAVKCRVFAEKNWWYLKVTSQPSEAFVTWFDQKLTALVAKLKK